MCFLARKGGGDEYERAVYGILSGDISSVEPVCNHGMILYSRTTMLF